MNHFAIAIFTTTVLAVFPSIHAQANQPADLASRLVDLLQQENFSEAVGFFDNNLLETLPADQLSTVWKDLISQFGAYKRRIEQSQQIRSPFSVVIVTCEFEKKVIDIKLVFNKKKLITGLWFLASRYEKKSPQHYQSPPYAYLETFSEQKVVVGEGRWTLPASLALPNGSGPFPAVVLVHDRGPNDRDETIGPNKPFRDLAWGLASRGIAVLRYEKRTEIYDKDSFQQTKGFTVRQEVIDDVLLAISLLLQNQQIDPKSVFILGHGFGGMLVPRIVKNAPDLAGAIILAGHVAALEDVCLRVQNYLFSLDNEITKTEKQQLAALRKQIDLVKDLRLEKKQTIGELPLTLPLEYWLDIRQYHPGVVGQTLSQPMLILQGGRDYEVTFADFRGWKKYLTKRKNVRYKLYLKLNHLFMEKKGGGKSSPEDYLVPGHVDQRVIDSIADWIIKAPASKVGFNDECAKQS